MSGHDSHDDQIGHDAHAGHDDHEDHTGHDAHGGHDPDADHGAHAESSAHTEGALEPRWWRLPFDTTTNFSLLGFVLGGFRCENNPDKKVDFILNEK